MAFGTLGLSTSAASGGSSNNPYVKLQKWMSTPAYGKTVAIVGDSTSDIAGPGQYQYSHPLSFETCQPTGEWAGATVTAHGISGSSLAAWTLTPSWRAAVVADNPSLIIICLGINDVRIGTATVPTLISNYQLLIDQFNAAIPGIEIVLWNPNSLLLTDVAYPTNFPLNANGGQIYTTQMYQAWLGVKEYPNVLKLDKMDWFGTAAPVDYTVAPHLMGADAPLHPNNDGQTGAWAKAIQFLTPPVNPIDPAASDAAILANPTSPWTVYSRVLEDPRYFYCIQKVTYQYFSFSSGLLYLSPRNAQSTIGGTGNQMNQSDWQGSVFSARRIMWANNATPFVLTNGNGANFDWEAYNSLHLTVSADNPCPTDWGTAQATGSNAALYRQQY